MTHRNESLMFCAMTKRLHVLLDDAELRWIQRHARGKGMSTAEWVRQALRAAGEAERGTDPRRKLEAIRTACRFEFPVGEIDELLAEIESSRADVPTPSAVSGGSTDAASDPRTSNRS